MNDKIYVIVDGIYSDYHIIAATTDYARAKKLAEMYGANIEEYENSTERSLIWFCVSRDLGGNVVTDAVDIPGTENVATAYKFVRNENGGKYAKIADGLFTFVQAIDAEHAKKIAIDKFTEYEYAVKCKEAE